MGGNPKGVSNGQDQCLEALKARPGKDRRVVPKRAQKVTEH